MVLSKANSIQQESKDNSLPCFIFIVLVVIVKPIYINIFKQGLAFG